MDIDIKIHIYNCRRLGGKNQWDWKQNNIFCPDWRLYWNKSPGAFVQIGKTKTELTPDFIFLMSPGTVYSSRTTDEVLHFYTHFTADKPFNSVTPQFFRVHRGELLELAAEAASAINAQKQSWRTLMTVKTLIISTLLRIPEKAVPPLKTPDPRIEHAISVLSSRKNMGNRSLAEEVNMSINNFLRLFQRDMSTSPQLWARKKRLDEACRLLQFTGQSIEEIAAESGFCDRYHFSRAFKQQFMTSPAQYRKQAKILLET